MLGRMCGKQKNIGWRVVSLFGVVLVGCSTTTDIPRDPTESPHSSSITRSEVAAATFSGVLDAPFTLRNGRFEGEPYVDGAASRPVVMIRPGSIVLQDLDGDGFDEAAAVLVVNTGGSGTFFYLSVVANKDGIAQGVAVASLGDRTKLQHISVDGRRIMLESLEHGAGDPMCCPTETWRREWLWTDDGLTSTSAELLGKSGGTERLRGHLVWGHEMRSFTECETGRTAWVYESESVGLAEMAESLASEPYQALFVEIVGKWVPKSENGFAADFAETLSVQRLLRAEREGFGCNENLADIEYRARGNEPSWRLDLRPDSLSFSSINNGEMLFPAPEVTITENGLIISGTSGKDIIEVAIIAGRCIDTMSGSLYSFTTTISTTDQSLSGCALAGPAIKYPDDQ